METSKAIWDKLQDIYERNTSRNRNLLVRKFIKLKYKDDTDMSEHLNEMKSILTQLARLKMTLDDD